MSRRLAEQLEETLQETAAPTPADGEEAEAELVRVLKSLVATDDIKLIPQEG